ncbi:MAG: glycosyltransferase [Bacteroidales bacterium]
MKNKALLLIDLQAGIGGAQKRYINLAVYLQKRTDFKIIINSHLFYYYQKLGFLFSKDNIILVHLPWQRPLTPSEADYLSPKVKKRGVLIPGFLLPFKRLVKHIILWTLFIGKLNRIIKTYNIRLIYSLYTGGIWSWPLFKIKKIRHIYSYMDSTYYFLLHHRNNLFLSEHYVLKNADLIDCLSPKIAHDLKNKFNVETPKSISPNSFIIYDNYQPEYPKNNWVVFMARLCTKKNAELFLHSIKYFNENYKSSKSIKFFIIGYGDQYRMLRNFATMNGIENVIFTGEVEKPYTILSKSKVFVSLQQDENYPSQAIMEAMACENAIVATNVGNTSLLTDSSTGVLVSHNPKEIADAIFRLISLNEQKLAQIGKLARNRVMKKHNIINYLQYFLSITTLP